MFTSKKAYYNSVGYLFKTRSIASSHCNCKIMLNNKPIIFMSEVSQAPLQSTKGQKFEYLYRCTDYVAWGKKFETACIIPYNLLEIV